MDFSLTMQYTYAKPNQEEEWSIVHMGSLGFGFMTGKYVKYNETSTLAPT